VTIVDPITETPGSLETLGEVWVASDCNRREFVGESDKVQSFSNEYFQCRLNGRVYARTGLAGFIQKNYLYVAGALSETLKVDGRRFFASDIESR
jgi:acyl-CoA synthetase (AMP-forming)/AMP-acid ligase II